MKIPLSLTAALFAALAFAEREMTLGEYAAETRSRVRTKIREALDGKDSSAAVSGTVTYAADGCVFLQRGPDGLKMHASGTLPDVGDVICVDGAPSLEGGHVVLVAKSWKKVGVEVLPDARTATSADLIRGGDRSVNGLRVKMEGRAIGVTENGFALTVDDVPVTVMVSPLPDFLSDCGRTHPLVSVTGVAEQVLEQSILLGREGYVMGVKIDVSSPSDIVLRPDLTYLVARRDRMLVLTFCIFAGALALGVVVFVFIIFRQRREMFRTRTVMAERKRMADDIHDTIEQHLVGAGMLLKLNRTAEAQDILVRAKREIRDIVWGLKNDDMMRLSPADMLRNLAHAENTKGLCRVDTRLDGLPGAMDAASMRDLSLIVRESIGNAVKHGGAKKIAIFCDSPARGGWRLRISNDGTPFDPETAPGAREGHFGLEGMKQRARRLGAAIRFERRGNGMVLVLEKGA